MVIKSSISNTKSDEADFHSENSITSDSISAVFLGGILHPINSHLVARALHVGYASKEAFDFSELPKVFLADPTSKKKPVLHAKGNLPGPAYELVFIARPDLSESQIYALVSHFSKILEDSGGVVFDHEYWGLKTMAYKINKYRKGHYVFFKLYAPPVAMLEMERMMRLHDDVMRTLTVKVVAHTEARSGQEKSSTGAGLSPEEPMSSLDHRKGVTRVGVGHGNPAKRHWLP